MNIYNSKSIEKDDTQHSFDKKILDSFSMSPVLTLNNSNSNSAKNLNIQTTILTIPTTTAGFVSPK